MRIFLPCIFPVVLTLAACSGETSGVGSGSGDHGDGGAASGHSQSAASDDGGVASQPPLTVDAGGGAATCASTFTALCEKSWSCSQNACRFAIENDAGASIGSMSWNTVTECTNFWLYTCSVPGGVRADFDFDACTHAIATSSCTSTPQGSAMVYPAVCNVNAHK